MNRELICPAIYRHFKGMNYATMLCSKPITLDDIREKISYHPNIFKFHYITAIYTEDLETEILIFKINNDYYHLAKEVNEELVIYRPLYPFKFATVARPKDMFLSKVDKEKYPEVEQEYRFELVKY